MTNVDIVYPKVKIVRTYTSHKAYVRPPTELTALHDAFTQRSYYIRCVVMGKEKKSLKIVSRRIKIRKD